VIKMASIRIEYDGSSKELDEKLVACLENKIKSGEWKKYNPYPNSEPDTQEFLNRLEGVIDEIKHGRSSKGVPLDEFTWAVDALVRKCYKEVGAKIIEED